MELAKYGLRRMECGVGLLNHPFIMRRMPLGRQK